MPNMLQSGAAWLGGQLHAHAGRTVSIIQGGEEISGLTATAAVHRHDVIDSDGFATSVAAYDWLFAAADLPSDFVFRAGTIIKETVGTLESRYEAMPLGSRPCVEPSDSSGILLVLHTKRVQ